MISSYPPSYALMMTFDVDGSLDVFFYIHGLLVCHSDTSQSIPWQALDECPQTVEVVFGLPMARPIKFWACRKKYKMADAKTRGTCVSHPSFNETITWIFEKGESHFRQIQSDLTIVIWTWRENKIMASVVCSNSTSQSFVFDISQYISISEQLYSQAWKTNY